MARYLGLDWDNNQLHLVAATTGRGGGHVERAVVWQDDFTPAPGKAEAIGQRLREFLRSTGIAPAPVLACVGRDRCILKEIRHPAVPAAEEAALVRFQASKELTDGAESMVLDYAAKGPPAPSGERTAFVFAARRDAVLFLQAICKVAGFKLLAVTPRGYAVAACLKRSAGTAATPAPDAAEAVEAVLTVSGTWADFSVVRGETLLFTRSVPVDGNLAADVRRNLAVYAGQAAAARDKVHALYIAAAGPHAGLVEELRQTLSLPVHVLDPFARDANLQLTDDRGGFVGAVGMVALWAAHRKAPVNFVLPKEPVKQTDPETRRAVRHGAIAGAVALVVIVLCWMTLSSRSAQVAELRADKARLDMQLTALAPDAKHIQALKEWSERKVSWLDELYEVTAHFNYEKGFHLTEFSGSDKPQVANRPGVKARNKDKYVGILSLIGEVPRSDERWVDSLTTALKDPNHQVQPPEIVHAADTKEKKDLRVFRLKAEVMHQEPRNYKAQFYPPSSPGMERGRGSEMDLDDSDEE